MERVLNKSDLTAMAALIENCRQAMGLVAELAWTKESLGEALKIGQARGLFREDRLLAFVLYIELGGQLSPDSIEIWCLATDPHFQGQGFMGTLLAGLQNRTQELWLEVHERNGIALGFYKNKGFQQVGLRKRYYEDGADALLLSWSSKKP